MPDLSAYLPPPFVWWIIGAIVAAGVALVALRVAWRSARKSNAADLLTYLAAGIATGVSMSGMWQFFDKVFPDLPTEVQVALFAFIEISVLASAVRARRNMRESAERAKTESWVTPSAGIDGTAVWALTGLSAVLSSLEAGSPPEFLFRLAAPLVAAWLWERGMAIERHRITGRSRIKWRLTPERAMVRLGLAETSDRTASDVDAHRRLTRVAKAAKRARALTASGAREGRRRRALARLDRALERAVEYAGLASDESRQREMLDQIGALYSSATLLALPEIAPWSALDHPLTAGYARHNRPGTPTAVTGGGAPGGAPGAPVDLPAAILPHGPVPDELCPVAVKRFTEDLEAGTAPSLKRIKDTLNVGQDRATRIQTYLTLVARTWPSGAQVQPAPIGGYAPPTAATFHEPTTANGSRLVTDIEMTALEVS